MIHDKKSYVNSFFDFLSYFFGFYYFFIDFKSFLLYNVITTTIKKIWSKTLWKRILKSHTG